MCLESMDSRALFLGISSKIEEEQDLLVNCVRVLLCSPGWPGCMLLPLGLPSVLDLASIQVISQLVDLHPEKQLAWNSQML